MYRYNYHYVGTLVEKKMLARKIRRYQNSVEYISI